MLYAAGKIWAEELIYFRTMCALDQNGSHSLCFVHLYWAWNDCILFTELKVGQRPLPSKRAGKSAEKAKSRNRSGWCGCDAVYVLNGAVYHYEFLIPLVLDSIRLINVDNPKARDSHRQHWKKIKITLWLEIVRNMKDRSSKDPQQVLYRLMYRN